MRLFIHEKEAGIEIKGIPHLDQLLAESAKQAKDENILSIICLIADNRNSLGIVIGGDETVLSFSYGHENPPYYASQGEEDASEPVLTCYLFFQHHTEFPRKHVIPFSQGLLAVHEFYTSGELPGCLRWTEV